MVLGGQCPFCRPLASCELFTARRVMISLGLRIGANHLACEARSVCLALFRTRLLLRCPRSIGYWVWVAACDVSSSISCRHSLPGGYGIWLYALEAYNPFGLIRLEIELLLGGISMTLTRWVCRHNNYWLIRPLVGPRWKNQGLRHRPGRCTGQFSPTW